MKILYLIINGEITGGNIICLRIIEECLKNNHKVIVNSPTEGKFTDLLKEKGIKVYNIDTRRIFQLGNAIKLAYIIKKEGIDLIHSHTPLAGTVLSRLAGGIAGVSVVNHAHLPDFMNPNPLVRGYKFLLNWITSRLFCAKVIAVSKFVKREIIKQGIVANKIVTVYNGIDLENIGYDKNTTNKIRDEFGIKQNQRIIGSVGRLGDDKGQHILIKAAQGVIKHYPHTVFVLVGEDLARSGEYRKTLEELASDLGLKQQIIFTGYRSDILDLMNAFDIFVLSSTFTEGLPVVILEAMIAKKPVIATTVGGTQEIVIHGQTGTLVPPQDSDKLAQAIIYHLENPQISKKMGEKGYERVRQYFSLSQMTDKIIDIYKEVLFKSEYKLKSISIIKGYMRVISKLLLKNQKALEDFKKNCKANKILVISLTHLGDIILLSPFLRNLRLNFPKAQIDILLKSQVSEILEYCPHIDNRIIYNAKWVMPKNKKGDGLLKTLKIIYQLRRNHYNLSFVTHPHIFNNMISWLVGIPFRVGYDESDGFLNIRLEKERQIQHARNYPLKLLKDLGLNVESDELKIHLGQKDIAFAEKFRKDLSLSNTNASFLVGIHPGAGDRERIWLLDRYAKVIQYLINKYNAHILLFASREEADITEKIIFLLKDYQQSISDLTGKTDILQMAALMKICKVILTNDAGPMHIASALNKPILALFANTPDYWPKIWGPLSRDSQVVSGANVKGNRSIDIKVDDVIRALDEIIECQD